METKMDDMKLVVKELNSRLGKKLNVISYDNLRGEQRLEMLLQVFKEIDPTINLESFEVADPEEVVVRALEMLRIFKYTPPTTVDPSTFRQAIIIGDKAMLTHVLVYLLTKLDDLKKRAYLARFLVKIEVSGEVEGDNDIVQLYQQYEQLIENFKVAHTTREGLKKSSRSVQEIQRDIKTMEDEKEQVSQKLSNVKRKVDPSANSDLFEMVTAYRDEKEKNEKMSQQSAQQETELLQLTHRLTRVANQLKEAQHAYQAATTPSEMLDKLNEEIDTKRHLVSEVLTKELQSIERYVQDLKEIESQPSVGPEYLDKINQRMQSINREINAIVEKKMLREDTMDDKLTLFKQNAATVAKKRETMKSKLNEVELKLHELREQLDDKKQAFDGQEILKGDALKQYVTSIRNKGNVYKRKKTELGELRSECGLRARTLELLQAKERIVTDILVAAEEQRGIAGYFSMQEQTRNTSGVTIGDIGNRDGGTGAQASIPFPQSNNRDMSVDELTGCIRKLNADITDKKAQLAPVIKDLRPLRQQCQDLQAEYEQKKGVYDATAAGLESALAKLEQEVRKCEQEATKLESNEYKAKCELEVHHAYESMLADEMRCFVSTDGDDKSKSIQEKLQKELFEQQERGELLKAKQKHFKENEAASKRQVKLWRDLQTLLEMKKVCLERQMQAKSARKELTKQDHLIL